MAESLPVLVIGAGFTGTVLARHLARLGVPALLLDAAPPGPGLAYGTADPLHLLNVPAKAMSAFAEEPGHFLDWLRRQDATELGPLCPDGAGPDAFVPRRLYGRYLREVAAGLGHRAIRVEALRRDGAAWVAEPGGIRGRAVALCLGNPPPAPAFAGPGVVADPWAPGALAAIPPGEEVLILGSGLTMADVVLSLRERMGHGAPITALSRHGWAPLGHATPLPAPRPAPPLPVAAGVAAMARAIRTACREAPWQAGLDGFRPQLQDAWRAMDAAARARFLRHGRTAWNIHRHRLPPAVAALLAAAEAAGTLRRRAGRLAGFTPGAARLADGAVLPARHLILCTGPDAGGGLRAQPLVAALLADGLLQADAHGLGLLADPATLEAAPGLHLLGPATRALLWEATAVPELRAQAALVAARLAGANSTGG